MRWLFLVFCWVVFVKADDPLVFQAGQRTEIAAPSKAEEVWVSYSPAKHETLPIQWAEGKAYVELTNVFVGWGAYIMASRFLVEGRWASIRPALTQTLPRAGSFSGDGFLLGSIPSEGRKAFSIQGQKDQLITFNVFANRLGSQLDPVLKIFNSKGLEVASCDDYIASGRDPMIYFLPPVTGSFKVELADVANGNGSDFFYCLAAKTSRTKNDVPYFPFIEFRSPEGANTFSSGDPVNLLKASGSFEENGTGQIHRFEAKAGERIIISAETRRNGSPCDAGLQLKDSNGKLISESVGADSSGAAITNRFEKAGQYQVEVREISRLSGPGIEYWLTVQRAMPGVILSTESERLNFSKEGEAKLKIVCVRYDYDGSVALKVDGLPEGVTLEGVEIPAKKNEVELKLKANGKVEAFNIRVRGAIRIKQEGTEETEREFPVSTMPALRKLYPLMMFPTAAMDGWIAVNPPN